MTEIVKFNASSLASTSKQLGKFGGGVKFGSSNHRLARSHSPIQPMTICYGVDFTASTSGIATRFVDSVAAIQQEVCSSGEHSQYFGSFHGNGQEISNLNDFHFYETQENQMGNNQTDKFVKLCNRKNADIIIMMLDGWEGDESFYLSENTTLVVIYDYNGGSGSNSYEWICNNVTDKLGEHGICINGLGSLNIKELIGSLIKYQAQCNGGAGKISFQQFLSTSTNGKLPEISQKLLN